MKQRQANSSGKEKVNGAAPPNVEESLRNKIAIRAYELFIGRGGENGHAAEDWLEAEQQIKTDMQRG